MRGPVTVVATRSGKVRGATENGICVFRGIPYAQPPVGPLRFAAPAPHEAWSGVRDATEFGPAPPQPDYISPSDDEWLTLNVWTPDVDASGLPVMVWLYGGRFTTGSGDDPTYDGSRLAATGVVVVTLNYRVAAEGFMFVDGAPANRGLLDQIAALQWIRDNIAGFGGDPQNVTLFGESAGAGSIALLMIAPAAAGLFRRGIAESVPAVMFGADLAADVAAVVHQKAGSDSPQALADAIADISITDHQDRWGYPLVVRRAIFGPVIDGTVVPDTPWRAMAAGAGRDIELIVGHNRDEYDFVIVEEGWPQSLTEKDAERALRTLPPTPEGASAYRAAYPDADHRTLYQLVCSDFVYRMPTLHLAQAHQAGGGTTFLYEFCFDASPLGAAHTTEIPLVFGTLDTPFGSSLYRSSPDAAAVSREMSSAWSAFAVDGDPGWPPYEPVEQLTRIFDVETRTAVYPEQASQRIWAGYPFDPFRLAR
jgi:para-nitrobenzyl esterase